MCQIHLDFVFYPLQVKYSSPAFNPYCFPGHSGMLKCWPQKSPIWKALLTTVFRSNDGKIGNWYNSMILNSSTSCIGTKACEVLPSSHLAGEKVVEFQSPLFSLLTIRMENKHKHMISSYTSLPVSLNVRNHIVFYEALNLRNRTCENHLICWFVDLLIFMWSMSFLVAGETDLAYQCVALGDNKC